MQGLNNTKDHIEGLGKSGIVVIVESDKCKVDPLFDKTITTLQKKTVETDDVFTILYQELPLEWKNQFRVLPTFLVYEEGSTLQEPLSVLEGFIIKIMA